MASTELARWLAWITSPNTHRRRLFYEKLYQELLDRGRVYVRETFEWDKPRNAQRYIEMITSKGPEARLLVRKREGYQGRWYLTWDVEAIGKMEKVVKLARRKGR